LLFLEFSQLGGDDLAPPVAAPVELDIGPVETHAEMHDEKFDDAFEGTAIEIDQERESGSFALSVLNHFRPFSHRPFLRPILF
jgi:hypothetical protein